VSMARLRWGVVLIVALGSCTSSSQGPKPAADAARYFFAEPKDTGVLEVTANPAAICYSTQSDPARPIDIVAKVGGGSEQVASYAPGTETYCDQEVSQDVVARLIADPTSFAVRWKPRANEPSTDTLLTTP
jgi:hypothetical protein